MDWLKSMSKLRSSERFHSRLFIFDEQYIADEYAEFLTELAASPSSTIVSEDTNWDQAGILTKLVLYKVQEGKRIDG
jgi:hypothetical protein